MTVLWYVYIPRFPNHLPNKDTLLLSNNPLRRANVIHSETEFKKYVGLTYHLYERDMNYNFKCSNIFDIKSNEICGIVNMLGGYGPYTSEEIQIKGNNLWRLCRNS